MRSLLSREGRACELSYIQVAAAGKALSLTLLRDSEEASTHPTLCEVNVQSSPLRLPIQLTDAVPLQGHSKIQDRHIARVPTPYIALPRRWSLTSMLDLCSSRQVHHLQYGEHRRLQRLVMALAIDGAHSYSGLPNSTSSLALKSSRIFLTSVKMSVESDFAGLFATEGKVHM